MGPEPTPGEGTHGASCDARNMQGTGATPHSGARGRGASVQTPVSPVAVSGQLSSPHCFLLSETGTPGTFLVDGKNFKNTFLCESLQHRARFLQDVRPDRTAD